MAACCRCEITADKGAFLSACTAFHDIHFAQHSPCNRCTFWQEADAATRETAAKITCVPEKVVLEIWAN